MTKLEEKLIELGYRKTYGLDWKKFCGKASITLTKCCNKITSWEIPEEDYLTHLDIKRAFNEMQKDLEILEGVEDE